MVENKKDEILTKALIQKEKTLRNYFRRVLLMGEWDFALFYFNLMIL